MIADLSLLRLNARGFDAYNSATNSSTVNPACAISPLSVLV
jgi:hypothetical protein